MPPVRSPKRSPRVLSYNVASLLRAAPGTIEHHQVKVDDMRVADDMVLVSPVEGDVRLSHTGRGVLARADLTTAIAGTCGRCLRPVVTAIDVHIDEEALPSIDIDSGLPVDVTAEPDALRLNDHHELDLETPVREAISLAEPIAILCRPDCRGLCPECGIDLNDNPSHAHTKDDIDPRLAALAKWQGEGQGDS
jgi:uncharacterized protein